MTTAGERTALQAGLHFVVPVWGDEYTRCFTELCLPTLLAPGNLPSLPHRERHRFVIYTTPRDRQIIEVAPVFTRIARLIRVEFHPVRARVGHIINQYDVQSDCFRRAIRNADAADQALVFLTPDMIIADGSLHGLARIADTKARAVLGVGIRLDKALVRNRLLAEFCPGAGDAIAMAPRDMARLAFGALHPISTSHMFHAESDSIQLSNLYWRVGNEGLLARCFHLHPFLVYPRVKNAPFGDTVDGGYLEAACPDLADAYIVTDSDEFSVWELSDAGRSVQGIARSRPLSAFLTWVRDNTTPRHRTLVGHAIRIHCGMTDHALWRQTELESGESVAKLLELAEQHVSQGAATQSASSLRFVTAVRSVDEARAFVAVALPSALAPGNIPRLPNRTQARYIIVAPAEGAKLIDASPAYTELREHMPAEIRVVGDLATGQPDFVTACHIDVLRDAAENNAAAYFIDPDAVFAGTSLDSAWRVCQAPFRAMVAPRLRIVAESAMPLLNDLTVEGLLSVASEELICMAMAHLHRASASQMPGGDDDLIDPDALLWPIANEGLIMHPLAVDPVLIYPRRAPSMARRLDDLLLECGLRHEEVGSFNDSTYFLQCRLTAHAASAPTTRRGDLALWAADHTTLFQHVVFRKAMRFGAIRARGAHWKTIEATAADAVSRLLTAIESAASGRGER